MLDARSTILQKGSSVDEQNLPEVRFDLDMGMPIYPRPVIKHAVLVPIPRTEDGSEIPTFIKPEWGGLEVFYGDYYAIITEGMVVYGSAQEQWEAMHTSTSPGYWVKTTVPEAYRASERCRIVTLIPSDDGGIRETSNVVEPGDWIVRQPGGEVQRISAEKYDKIYFSQQEAEAFGFDQMSDEEFSDWAVARALQMETNT